MNLTIKQAEAIRDSLLNDDKFMNVGRRNNDSVDLFIACKCIKPNLAMPQMWEYIVSLIADHPKYDKIYDYLEKKLTNIYNYMHHYYDRETCVEKLTKN